MDDDVGYGILRVTRDQEWELRHLGNPIYNFLLGTFFEVGVALHHLETEKLRNKEKTYAQAVGYAAGRQEGGQAGCQGLSDLPALSLKNWRSTLTANFTANIIRNYWAYMVISAVTSRTGRRSSPPREFENEDQARWYLRQMLGSANFTAGPLMWFMSGNPATRSSTTCIRICRATGTRRSVCGCACCARNMTCRTHDGLDPASVCADVPHDPCFVIAQQHAKATSDDARKRRRNCGSTFRRVCRSSSASIRTPENGRDCARR